MRSAVIGALGGILALCQCALGLNPSLDVSQYAHTAWTVQDGFSAGNIYAMAQTPDGYLWLGTEFGLFRFDGVRIIPWTPPAGQHLPEQNINCLLVTRDGTLWIGTFSGLVTWSGGKLTRRPEVGAQFVASLFEDREGTVWAATLETPTGRLCAIRSGGGQCYGQDGAFGRAVWALYEDNSGALWAAAESGLWRWKPGAPRRYATPELIGLSKTDDGRLLIAMHGRGLMQLSADKVESYPLQSALNPNKALRDRDVDSNRLLRDRDGGLWIGTVERGLIHVHHGRTDVFTRSDGLSGDVILSVLEDREGNIWTASTGGLDRFREFPVSTVSVKQGLSSDATQSVLAATDGSVWVGAHDGLTRWKNGEARVFRKANGVPDDAPESLYQDDRGRIWVSTRHGSAFLKDGRFVAVDALPAGEVHFITGDNAGNLWMAGHQRFFHMLEGRLVEQIPWSKLGRTQSAAVLLPDRGQDGVWLGFWVNGGLSYFKDGRLRVPYTAADGLGEGPVPDLQLDRDGALWAATEQGGLSRVKDGRIATLTSKNGLPCDAIHWSIEDDDRSLWLYTACGLVRIRRTELDAWIVDPKRRIKPAVWGAEDGVRIRSSAASAYGPRATKSTDGKLWFVTGEGVQVVDPHHLAANQLPPPVHIEQIAADHKTYWQHLPGADVSNLHLPALTRDLQIDYTALSLVAPERNRFRYKLEGRDRDWIDAGNRRQAFYTDLKPLRYRFRVIASNNSGVWNETGESLDFSVDPAYYQTTWFSLSCVGVCLIVLWALYQLRLRQLSQQFNMRLEDRVNERTRIASDLHDTLLQSVQGLMLRLQAVRNLLPANPTKAVEALDEALEKGDQAILEGRVAVGDLRSSTEISNDLVQAFTAFGDGLASKDAATFRVMAEGASRDLHPILRDEIYRIACEAIRNAFRHAHASRIEAEITYGESLLRVRIRDDGRGIDPKIAVEGCEGHYGLVGMRERAKRIGGQLSVWTGEGTGTEIELNIPGSIAYGTSRARDGFRLFRKKGRNS